MKNKIYPLLFVSLILLTSCQKPVSSSSSNKESSSSENSSRTRTGKANIEIYASNDFHGAVSYERNKKAGLAYFGTYFKNKGDEPNTLLIDSGDSWQGSVESNYNHGKVVNDVMYYAGFDARSVGNHDFDWGLETVIENNKTSYFPDGVMPTLAANVYDYDWANKKTGNTQQKEIGQEYVTYTLENGVKVGIIGGIGEDQITSIMTKYVQNIVFTNYSEKVKKISDKLRNEEKCDVVIASVHAGQDEVLNTGLTSISPISGKKYVDLVLCAHTHRSEYRKENRVLFIQSQGYGQSFSHITLTYDFDLQTVDTSFETLGAYDVVKQTPEIDPTIQEVIDYYAQETEQAGKQIIESHMSGEWYSSEALPNLMCKAIYEECLDQGYDDVALAMTNSARASIYSNRWTYKEIYQAFPFDNYVYIAEVNPNDLYRELPYSYIYRSEENFSEPFDRNKTYKVAVIDYLLFHTNTERNYDYFANSSYDENLYLKKENKPYPFREILVDYLKEQESENVSISAQEFMPNLWHFNTDLSTPYGE